MAQKTPDTTNPNEISQSISDEYLSNLFNEIQVGKSKFFPNDFFIVVITKNERLMKNVFRNYFFSRLSCPTPDYDQSLYRYIQNEEVLEYIWTIPSKEACHYLKNYALEVDKNEHELLKFVLDFADGTLFKQCKILNGETDQAGPQLEKYV